MWGGSRGRASTHIRLDAQPANPDLERVSGRGGNSAPLNSGECGKQNHQCKACGRQFTADPLDRSIPPEQRRRIEQLLCERLSLRGICRTMGVSLTWLLHFMVECFTACPEHLHAQLPTQPTQVLLSRLEAEADAMWSFVQ